MFNLGLDELLVIGILAAFFLDAKKLAQAFKWIRVTRNRLNNLQYDIEEKVDEYLHVNSQPGKMPNVKTPTNILLDDPPEARGGDPITDPRNTKSDAIDVQSGINKADFRVGIDDLTDAQDQNFISPQSVKQDQIPQDQARDISRFRLERFSDEEREAQSEDLIEELNSIQILAQSNILAAFMPLQAEVDILPFLENWKLEGKTLIIPKIHGDELEFYKLDSFGDLQQGTFNILEPKGTPELLYVESPDVILVPGIAFDESGNRVGRGRGFYDRYLKKHPKAVKVGICFEKQLLNGYIAPNSWDIPMDYIASSRRTLSFDRTPRIDNDLEPKYSKHNHSKHNHSEHKHPVQGLPTKSDRSWDNSVVNDSE
jgi:5-formyltetrahydrofolate cyclo-ligase